MGVQGVVGDQSDRPLPLDRISFPVAKESIQPFQAGCLMPHNIRSPQQAGNFLEAVTVLALSDTGDKVFVKFYRTGNTAWIDTDRLADH